MNATFSKPISTETFAYVVAPDPGGWLATWSRDRLVVALSHNAFGYFTAYDVAITGAEDLAGNSLLESYRWSFTTERFFLYLPLLMH